MPRATEHAAGRGLVLTVILWTFQVACGAVFLLFGAGKLLGWPDHIATFDALGFGQWLRYAVGVAEVLGALLLFVPRLAGLAAAGLAIITVGAVCAHVFILMDDGWVLPLIMTVVLLFIAWFRRTETASLVSTVSRT